MFLLDRLAEDRINRARDRGELDNLSGAGQPLELDDDSMVPPELRTAWRLLKNAGYVPPEVERLRDIRDAEALLRAARGAEERAAAGARLRVLLNRIGDRRSTNLTLQEAYYQRLCERLDRD